VDPGPFFSMQSEVLLAKTVLASYMQSIKLVLVTVWYILPRKEAIIVLYFEEVVTLNFEL